MYKKWLISISFIQEKKLESTKYASKPKENDQNIVNLLE